VAAVFFSSACCTIREVVFIYITYSDNDEIVARYIDSCACTRWVVKEITPRKKKESTLFSLCVHGKEIKINPSLLSQ
jgi:hypothetical protein